ncbi:MAG: hypothetical protein II010_00290 [Oscillospiraceae bacterium]|nr:hypothetical protein [Oscillospiraceae bacterium]
MKTRKTGEETPYKDRDGKAIKVHNYIADATGARYYVNSACQAVPVGEGAAVPLEELVNDKELGVRVLSATEVGKLESERSATSRETPSAKQQQIDKKNDEEAAKLTKLAKEGKLEPTEEDIKSELQMILKLMPDEMLADELKRRGYMLQAIKINIKRI